MLRPLPIGQVNLKVTCHRGKSACPGRLNGTFFEPCHYIVPSFVNLLSVLHMCF